MTRMNARVVIAGLAGLLLCMGARSASAEQVQYFGAHPIAEGEGEAFCYIEVPHVHIYKPSPKHAKVLYRVKNNTYHFVGDPVGFGYDGDKYPYYGHHPISAHLAVDAGFAPDVYDDEYCYLDGPHYHYYAPPANLKFAFKGNAYWYVGAYPPSYRKNKKVLVGINAVYQPLVYVRPVVVVDARPVEYVGPVVGVDVVAPGVIVDTPRAGIRAGVEINVPVPTIEVGVGVGVGVPGVIVVDRPGRGHKKFKKFKKHRRGRR